MDVEVTKKINFVMGHRVYTQNLEKSLGKNKCRHLHGHEYVLEMYVKGDVKEDGMVLDFTYFNVLNDFIQKFFDHRFMISINDPEFNRITNSSDDQYVICYSPQYFGNCLIQFSKISDFKLNKMFDYMFATFVKDNTNIDLQVVENLTYAPIETEDEFYDSFILVDFVPTAENILMFIKRIFDKITNNCFGSVCRGRLYETQKAYCEISFC